METNKREKPLKIIVIGCGRWGSFIGWYLDHIGHNVTLYGLSDAPSFQRLLTERKNEYITLTPSIGLTTNINETKNKDVIIISVNSQNLRSVCHQLKDINLKDKTIVLCMKGIEIETGDRLTEIVSSIVDKSNKIM